MHGFIYYLLKLLSMSYYKYNLYVFAYFEFFLVFKIHFCLFGKLKIFKKKKLRDSVIMNYHDKKVGVRKKSNRKDKVKKKSYKYIFQLTQIKIITYKVRTNMLLKVAIL